MSTRWLSLCLAGTLGAAVADEPPKLPALKAPGPEQSLADQIAAIKRDYRDHERQFDAELRAAARDMEKVSKANVQHNEYTRGAADKLKALIRRADKEPAAFEGVLGLVGQMGHPLDDDLSQLVLRHHLADAKMGQLCFVLRHRTWERWAESILKEAAAGHPQAAVRGQATFALGDYHRIGIRFLRYPRKKLTEAEEAEQLANAERYYAAVVKDYAAHPTPDGQATLGAKAATELTRLKNIPNLKVGKLAPDIEGEDIDGVKFKLSDYRGKVVLLDFWGHW
jgi:hypothetical protein